MTRAPGARTGQTGGMAFAMKRVYDAPEPSDGYRVLVDRLWPRGVSKERAELDETFTLFDNTHSVRWMWQHLVEEYARHNGHADLIREAIDGSTGL